jgi:hypothetical protein
VLAVSARTTRDALVVELSDGRTVIAPLAWFPRLMHGTGEERNHWRLIAGGEGIHWPDLDEDISVEGLLDGRPSGESQKSFERWMASRTGAALKGGRSSRHHGRESRRPVKARG